MEKIDVLIVDDDSDVSGFIRRKLKQDAPHLGITEAGGGRECLEHLKTHHTDCILTDYQMPGMDGMELLLRLREAGDETPVIFVTGQGNEEVAREAFKNGAFDYFTKEVGFAHFPRIVNSIEQAVRQRRAREMKEAAETELAEEKAKLQSILSSIGDGISIQDRELRILYQNPAHISMIGSHAGEYCYMAYMRREGPCPGCPILACMEDGEVHRITKSSAKASHVHHVELTASPLRDSSGRIIAGIEVARDITAKVEAEESAASTKRTFAEIVGAIKFGMVIVGRDRIVRRANAAALRMMGLDSEDEIVGKVCHKRICPAEEGRCPILDLGQDVDLSEKVLLTAGGERIPILKTVTPVVMDGEELLLETFVDITALKDAQKEVAETRAFLQSVIDGAADPIMVVGTDYTVNLMNKAAQRLSTRGVDLSGQYKCYEVSHGEDRPCRREEGHDCPLEMVMESGAPVAVLHSHKNEKGEPRWVEITASPLRDSAGGITAIIETSRDITDRKKLERERLDLQAMVTHDMKGPLTAILGYSEILLEDNAGVAGQEARDMVSAINKNGKRLAGMIDGYLTFSRIEDGRFHLNPSPVDIMGLVDEAVAEYMELAKNRDIKLDVNMSGDLPYVMLDKGYMLRAVGNLIENAVNYTPEGGSVALSVETRRGASGDELAVTVSDTGPGIPAHEHGRIFEKYYRLAQSSGKKGTGLGLAVVKAVAEAHHGRVELESEPGLGSRFTLVIPVTPYA